MTKFPYADAARRIDDPRLRQKFVEKTRMLTVGQPEVILQELTARQRR